MAGTSVGYRIFGPLGIGFKRAFADTTLLNVRLGSAPTATWTATLPANPPGTTRALTMDPSGAIGFADLGSGGSVTSVALSLPNIFSVSGSPITTSGTLTASLANQSKNTVLAGPTTGADAAPTFRALAYDDLSSLVGTTASKIAAGNDSRFHSQNSDVGTSSTTFQIDSGNGGPRIKNNSGILEVRNSGDNAFASIRVDQLFVTGTATTIASETVTIADNILELNSNVTTGTPTEDAGVRVARGGSTAASLLWLEASDKWAVGVAGSEYAVARVRTFTFSNADLVSGILTTTHNLDNQYPQEPTIYDSNNKVVQPDDYTATSVNVITTDLTSYGAITGTWRITVVG